MKKRTPKFLFFDLGRVLLNFDHEIGIRNLTELVDRNADRRVEQIRDIALNSSLPTDYERGDLTTEEFCGELRERLNLAATDQEICHAISDIFLINSPVIPIVAALHKSGWPLGILSNTCDAHWNHILDSRYDFLDLFDTFVLSFEERAAKPDKRIFEQAGRRVKLGSEEIFFVDDMQANVDGALKYGLDAVLFESARQLADDLLARGVNFDL